MRLFDRDEKRSYLVQVINGFFPLLAIPLIAETDDGRLLAHFFILLSVSGVISLLCDYGLSISGVRGVQVAKKSSNAHESVVALAMRIATTRLSVAVVLLSGLLPFAQPLSASLNLTPTEFLLTAVASAVLTMLNQNWALYSLHKTHYFNYIFFIARAVAFLLLWVFTPSPLTVLVFILAPAAVANTYSTISARKYFVTYKLAINWKRTLKGGLLEGKEIFLITIFSSGVALSWPLIFTINGDLSAVSLFGVIDRIVRFCMMFVTPILPFLIANDASLDWRDMSGQLRGLLVASVLILPSAAILTLGHLGLHLPTNLAALILGEYWQSALLLLALPLVFANSMFYTNLIINMGEARYGRTYVASFLGSLAIVSGSHIDLIYGPVLTELISVSVHTFRYLLRECFR